MLLPTFRNQVKRWVFMRKPFELAGLFCVLRAESAGSVWRSTIVSCIGEPGTDMWYVLLSPVRLSATGTRSDGSTGSARGFIVHSLAIEWRHTRFTQDSRSACKLLKPKCSRYRHSSSAQSSLKNVTRPVQDTWRPKTSHGPRYRDTEQCHQLMRLIWHVSRTIQASTLHDNSTCMSVTSTRPAEEWYRCSVKALLHCNIKWTFIEIDISVRIILYIR